MGRPYQLSKIGKETRKSGFFRFCGPGEAPSSRRARIPKGRRAPLQRAGESRSEPPRLRVSTTSKEGSAAPHTFMPNPIKKLPQAGQEPVEAVESRRIRPDAPYDTRIIHLGKDIPRKICDISARSPAGSGKTVGGRVRRPALARPSPPALSALGRRSGRLLKSGCTLFSAWRKSEPQPRRFCADIRKTRSSGFHTNWTAASSSALAARLCLHRGGGVYLATRRSFPALVVSRRRAFIISSARH
jgi:hypothetical protein